MRWVVVAVASLAVSGCDRAAERAEKELDLVQRSSGSYRDQCEPAKKVTAAWLERGDQDRYQQAKRNEDSICLMADMRSGLLR